MKKIILLFAIALLAAPALRAQKYVEKASAETCDCVTKSNPPDNITEEEFQLLITKCVASPMINYYEKICKELKIKADNSQSSFEEVGRQIGFKMGLNCPIFLKMALKVEQNSNDKIPPPPPADVITNEVTGSSSGVIKSIDSKDFYYITLTTNSGGEQSFIWLRYFPGSTPFENNPAAQVGKKVTIKYREIRCYSPAIGDYAIKKEITEIIPLD